MTVFPHWVLATSNRGKAVELTTLLGEARLTMRVSTQAELGVPPAPETAVTFVENALAKARHASQVTSLPAIADDSGLVVAALGGAPGVHSARFAGEQASDEANIAKLLTMLGARDDRSARFHCVLVAVERCDDPAPLIASGTWRGEIARARSGEGGFGYDPVFFDPRLGRTAAQLTGAQKNQVSHRGTALRALVELLKNR